MLEPTDRIGDCSLYLSENLAILRQMPSNSIEACVTDPPAGAAFMSLAWDTFKGDGHSAQYKAPTPKNRGKSVWQPGTEVGHTVRAKRCTLCGRQQWSGTPCQCPSPVWDNSATTETRTAFITWLTEIMAEVYRVLKPGAHALVWALPRTSHWTAMACEDAGFEVRDSVLHLFSSGYPKSLNISRAIDQEFGITPKVTGYRDTGVGNGGTGNHFLTENSRERLVPVTEPVSDAAKQYQGWGSNLAPAHETWWLCRKPLSESTLAKNVLKWGVGGLNVDGCRIPSTGESRSRDGESSQDKVYADSGTVTFTGKAGKFYGGDPLGRFPKNTILDGSDTVAAQFPQAPGQQGAVTGAEPTGTGFSGKVYGAMYGPRCPNTPRNEIETSAARFYYAAKASASDRGAYNTHATVKSTALMQYLIRLITPEGGTVLDLFAGSGSTGKAAILEGKKFLGIEREPEYYAIMLQRIQEAAAQLVLFP